MSPDPPPPARHPSAELTDENVGRWVVTTLTSRYFLDLDTRQVMRHPGRPPAAQSTDPEPGAPLPAGPQPAEPQPAAPHATILRGDGDVLRLRTIGTCRLGEPLVLYLDLRDDGVVTIRQSTQVIAIEQVAATEID